VSGVSIIAWTCVLTAVAVFAAMIGSVLAFARPQGGAPVGASGKAAEILWALIPIAIVLAAATPALRTIAFSGRSDTARLEPQSAAARSPAQFAQALNKK
jgi:heme/copper-type cytochrome/quinol oxidase subunit 2